MNLKERDKKHLWHPLTQHKIHPDALPIIKAEGALLYDDQGKEYIDGIASWYTAMYGHCNPYILKKVEEQMRRLDQIVFAGFTHEPAIKLSEELIDILPNNQEKIFFSDNGSTANEVGIKMALQYHFNKGEKRNTIIAFQDGFHGDTFGAMSASGLSVYNGPFEDFFIDVQRIPTPNKENFDEVIKQLLGIINSYNVAAFIYEPLVQGANAMHMFDAECLNEILKICATNNIITIADEVMTGFGKTGKHFASEYIETKPDIISMSKALTAGFVPMAVTSCTQNIYDAFLDDSIGKAFFHAHTYSANPIACSVAIAGIELLKSQEIQNNINTIIKSHQNFDAIIRNHSKVKTTRQKGVIYALDLDIEMDRYGKKRYEIFDHFMKNGVCLRPLGKTIYLLPPYVIKKDQLDKIYDTIISVLNSL
ncbi:adenosylmethionine--8-amino-7-oxononanoate transaminase [Aquimarina sp. AD1]|uniref:adenosylmethionine--8-amino-7-oxononanoate transaminase n=1 Tax=Aquimarina sp. (strain AD1) TaxID=1714848 RepID=UPI000E51177A|nr:adenosylmethionine--8-amino-7-oxononanoate transaminase [Aquimarina sp. AD1]AXT57021.1 adenosylmethionine--8-amino-7-oxononanoate transaminase [Aquimarina sp. AD1]RKN16946.1 adenosylmethionine--8-amino-7-oxononanoate transaminase [Aquimarina sp. AD1]